MYVAPATIVFAGNSSVNTGAAPNEIVAEDVTMIEETVSMFARPSGFRVSAELLIGRDGNVFTGDGCTVTTNLTPASPSSGAGAAIVPERISCVGGNVRANVLPPPPEACVAENGRAGVIGVVWTVEGAQLTIACATVIRRKKRIAQPRRKR